METTYKPVGFFSEMELTAYNNGSINDNIADKVDYDKDIVMYYLSSIKSIAVYPNFAIDCVTGETIDSHFTIHRDDEFVWPGCLIYHIGKYNIKLPPELISKAYSLYEDLKVNSPDMLDGSSLERRVIMKAFFGLEPCQTFQDIKTDDED